MRTRILTFVISLGAITVSAGDIREFDIKTIERIGNELTRVSQTRDKGATTPERKRAQQTAKTALKGKLFDIRYDYVVVDHPDGSGLLVYALGRGPKPGDTVVFGHFRVTVSDDGQKVQRVEALSGSLVIDRKGVSDLPEGYKKVGFYCATPIGTRPTETLVYASNHMKMPIAVGTPPHGQVWFIENGKITRDKKRVSASKPKK